MLSAQIKELEQENQALTEENRRLRLFIGKGENKAQPRHCESCKHFVQHYVRGGAFVAYGHCVLCRRPHNARHAEDTCKSYDFGTHGRR